MFLQVEDFKLAHVTTCKTLNIMPYDLGCFLQL